MRLKVIAILLFLTFVSSFVFAQDGGGKPLPGEGTPSVTPTPTSTDAAITTPLAPDEATATATTPAEEPTEAEPTEAEPTEAEPTEDNTTVDADVEFPAEMLSDTGLEFEENVLVLHETFDDEEAWELIDSRDQSASIEDGLYLMETEFDDSNNIPFAGLNNRSHGDVVMQVTTEQLSREPNNGYGFICRADEDNNLDGYHLWISGDGYATIFMYEDEGDSFVSLADWITSSTINQGTEVNVITAVCVGEYLGLFVNGDLVVEAEDDSYSEGVAGFSLMTFIEDTNIEVAFDELSIWEVSASEVEDPIDNTSSDFDPDAAADEVTDALEEADGDVAIELGDLLLGDDFSAEGDWTTYRGDMDRQVDEGKLIFDGGVEETLDFFYWAYNEDEDEHQDVVIRVDAEFIDGEDAEFGVMCRSTEASDGYNFLIDNSGNYVIAHWVGTEYTVLTDGDSDAINTDEAVNTIFVVCVGEYLALYVNDELVDEVEDDTYEEGITNLVVWQHTENSLTVSFDNIYVWEAND